MMPNFVNRYHVLLRVIEQLVALGVLIAVAVAAIGSTQALLAMDWGATETLYELIYRALLVVIGIELARMLVTHDLMAVLELLAFVIARKLLKPELASVDIALGVLAFVALVLARRFLATNKPNERLQNEAH